MHVAYQAYAPDASGKPAPIGEIGEIPDMLDMSKHAKNVVCSADAEILGDLMRHATIGDFNGIVTKSEDIDVGLSTVYFGSENIFVPGVRGVVLATKISSSFMIWIHFLILLFCMGMWRDPYEGALATILSAGPALFAAFAAGRQDYWVEYFFKNQLMFWTIFIGNHYIFPNESRYLSENKYLNANDFILTDENSYNSTDWTSTNQVYASVGFALPLFFGMAASVTMWRLTHPVFYVNDMLSSDFWFGWKRA